MRKSILLVPALVIVLAVFMAWLAATESGLRWAYRQALPYLPGELTVNQLAGSFLGPIHLRGISYAQDGMALNAEEFIFEWRPQALYSGNFDISRIYLRRLEIVMPVEPKTDSTTAPGQPISLPEISLPLGLQLKNAEIDGLTFKQDELVVALNQIRLHIMASQNKFHIDLLDIDAADFFIKLGGEIEPAGNYPHKLNLNWQVRLASGALVVGSGQLDGDLKTTDLQQQLTGALRVALNARLSNVLEQLQWQAKIDLSDFDSTRLDTTLPALSGALQLQGRGDLDTATVMGALQADSPETGPLNASFNLQRLLDNSIQINQLNLNLATDTQLDTRGLWIPAANGGDIKLDLNWKNLRWPLKGAVEVNSAIGRGSIEGNASDYKLNFVFDGPRPDLLFSSWTVNAEGNLEAIKLKSVDIKTLDGQLQLSADVSWKPVLSWQAKINATDLNPAQLLPEWPGNINAVVTSSGKLEADSLSASADITQLHGVLRDYPISLQSRLHWRDNGLDIHQFAFSSGDARVNADGRVGDELKLDWVLSAQNLGELYPHATGQLAASGQLSGPRSKPTVEATFNGQKLSLAEFEISALDGSLAVDLLTREQVDISINARDLRIGGESIESIDISADNRQLSASLISDLATAGIQLKGEFSADSWQGKVEKINLKTRDFSDWTLLAPAPLFIGEDKLNAPSLCLQSSEETRTCTSIELIDKDWLLNLELSDLPQSMFKPWLPDRLSLDGSVNASADIRIDELKLVTGKVNIDLPAGAVTYPIGDGEPQRWTYERGAVDLLLDKNETSARTEIVINASDAIDGWLKLPALNLLKPEVQKQAMRAGIKLNLQNLTLLEALIPEISGIKGKLNVDLGLSGSLVDPRVVGKAQLHDAAFDLAEFNQSFTDINLSAETEGDEKLKFAMDASYVGAKLAARGHAILNADAGWPTTLIIEANQFETARLLKPWLPENLTLEGKLDASAKLEYKAPDQLFGQLRLQLPAGALSYPLLEGESNRWEYHDGRITASLDDLGVTVDTVLATSNGGVLEARASLPGAKLLKLDIHKQLLQANAKLDIKDISVIEAMVPEINKLKGQVTLNLLASGTLAQPRIDANTQLLNASLRIPRIGLEINQIRLDGRSQGFEKFDFELSAKSGDGSVLIKGNTVLDGAAGWPSRIHISGENFEVSRIPEATVKVSPDLNIKIEKQRIDIDGSVHIPYAKLQPKDISSAARVSEDAVIIGGEQPPVEKWSIHTNVRLTLGDRVTLFGFGFEGRLGGSLVLRDEPGQLTRATGEISITEGRYRAYGQRLDVEKGRLIYTGGPIINPGLDLRAVRKVNNVTAGLKVKGTANQPVLELFSIPAMGQTDSLSYLLLGRPIENASGEEGASMAKAALALGLVGGDRLARTLGDRFGLDEMRLESSESGDQASLVVGRYLSPKLYVSYGVGLIESINTLSLRYKLSDKWQLKAESGEAQGADLLYTIER